MLEKYLVLSKEVEDALKNNKPVVALESTIISHGMPYPKNYETAINCERIVRENGATPATIAVIEGMIHVGLTDEEINYIAENGKDVIKTSVRDLPIIVSKKLNGATTVAATSVIANMTGIKIFATGGIGGVHRGGELSMDISCDLETLATIDVAVICAGAKAILDLGRTLEYLETKGVPVIGYKTKSLPAFYTKDSEFSVNYELDTPKEVAEALAVKWNLGLKGGALITNPIPDEYSLDSKYINKAIDEAILKMDKLGIKGKDQTPFLLKTIVELTGGNSLEANIKLVYNNVALASKIASELVKL